MAKLEEKWWGCKTTSSRCLWVLNVKIRGCLHGENKLIIRKILIFVGAFAPTIYNVASPVTTNIKMIFLQIYEEQINLWD
jgi:hypothetical protein